jgi:hypothetical protein
MVMAKMVILTMTIWKILSFYGHGRTPLNYSSLFYVGFLAGSSPQHYGYETMWFVTSLDEGGKYYDRKLFKNRIIKTDI